MIVIGGFTSSIYEPLPLISFNQTASNNSPSENLSFILQRNSLVLGKMLIGAVTFGLYSFGLLCWNAFNLGSGIITIFHIEKPNTLVLCSYIILEFTSLTLMATAAEDLGHKLFVFIISNRRNRGISKNVTLITCSFACVLLAALLETYYMNLG